MLVLLSLPSQLSPERTGGAGFIALGLATSFLHSYQRGDERGRSLQLKALAAGFYSSVMGFLFGSMMVRTLDTETVMRDLRHEPPLPSSLGIWDITIMTLVVAQLLFWFWRYRDARETAPVTGWRRVVQMCLTGR
ncbi:MAG: hypothetical protein IPL39_08480 [Opitutaceae bacterium]|nr:hypothetical protein [Opitutaceae bacterium]